MKSKRFFSFLVKNYDSIIAWFVLAVFIGFYIFLISKTFYIDVEGNIRTAIAGYGDIPLHLTQVSKFAFIKFNLEEPIYAGTMLQYPFLLNFLSGITLKLTSLWTFSFLWPPILFGTLSSILVFLIYKKILNRNSFAVVALIVFFFGSGMGAYRYIKDADSVRGLVDNLTLKAVSTITKWDAQYPDQNIDYGAPITLTIHQRPFFLGFLLFMIIVFSSLKILEGTKKKWPIIIGILAYAILPISHMHSFVAASIFIFSLFILFFIKKEKEKLNNILSIGVVGFLLAIPQIYYLIGKKDVFGSSANFFSFRVGWMTESTIGSVKYYSGQLSAFSLEYLKFLWVNFGVILVLFIFVTLLLFFKKFLKKLFNDTELFIFNLCILSGWMTFLTVMFFRFQPWDYDNNKLLVYWQFFAVLVIFLLLVRLYRFNKIIVSIITMLFIITGIYSGICDQIFRVNKSYSEMPIIFSTDARNLADYVKKNISEDDRILTSNTHLNAIASLSGRPVLEGFPGWLWTRGIDYGVREGDIKKMYSDPENNQQLMEKYNIKYILVESSAIRDFDADNTLMKSKFGLLLNYGDYFLYKVN